MLADVEECMPAYRCPRTKANLVRLSPDALICPAGHTYHIRNRKPILIDFSDSVVCEHDIVTSHAASQIPRKSYDGVASKVKRMLSPEKKETRINIARLVSDLRDLGRPARLLVVGGGTIGQGMRALYDNPDILTYSFDIYDSPHVQFIADAHHIPLPDGFFDAVVVQAVLEHVLRPRQVVSEIWRVLADDGLVYAETPFMQQVHEGPYDFTRFTGSGHRYLFRDFDHLCSGAVGGPGVQFMWSVEHLTRGVFHSVRAGKIAKLAFFWTQYFDLIIPPTYAEDGASGIFFYGRRSTRTMTPHQIIAFYRGAQKSSHARMTSGATVATPGRTAGNT